MIGVVSDTHDNVSAVERIVEKFEDEGVNTVIHCGDYIAPPVLPFLDTDAFELHGVLGNNDGEIEGLNAGFDAMDGTTLHGRFADLKLEDARFAVLHGESKDEVEALAESGAYDYVLYGHYHVKEKRDVNGTTVINPGAHFPTVPDEHRTVALIDTEKGGMDSVRFESVA
ncbi:MAG: metallophosphoesterase [Halobacteriales archaeon]|nr:metallophosphoesterase [Halobacteriales archaeon]